MAYYDRFLKDLEKKDLRKDVQNLEKLINEWIRKVKDVSSQTNLLSPIIVDSNTALLIKRCLKTLSSTLYKKMETK